MDMMNHSMHSLHDHHAHHQMPVDTSTVDHSQHLGHSSPHMGHGDGMSMSVRFSLSE